MKKILCISAIVFLFTSCIKEKDYTCKCVYVPYAANHPAGTPNIEETNKVSGVIKEDAASDCSIDYEGKYATQYYKGTCTLQ